MVAGLLVAAGALDGVMNEAPTAFLASTFGFSLVAASFAFITCSALSPTFVPNHLHIPGTSSLALWSYAVYLAYKPAFMALYPELQRLAIDPGRLLTIILVMATDIFIGWLLF